MITPVLETERILLRPLKISDAEDIFKNWASDPDVTKYMRWNTHQSVDVTVEWLTSVESSLASDMCYDWGFILKETGQIFGSGGIFGHDMFEIGYVIMKKYWNKGLTTEAARAMVGFAVNELGQTSLYGRHAKENIVSGKVLEKLGFVYRNDGEISSFDGKRVFQSKNYVLTTDSPAGGIPA